MPGGAAPGAPAGPGFPPGARGTPVGPASAPPAAPAAPPPATPPPARPGYPGGPPGYVPAGAAGGSVLGTIIKVILILILGGLAVGVGATAVGAGLLFTGNPATCVNRTATPDPAAAQQLRADWARFSTQIAAAPGSIQIDETKATSRAVEYIQQKNAPIDALQVHFCPGGYAEAAGKVKIVGRKVNVVARGTLDTSGPRPRLRIDSLRAGNLPSGVALPVVNRILDSNNLRNPEIKEHLTEIRYTDGVATITGGP